MRAKAAMVIGGYARSSRVMGGRLRSRERAGDLLPQARFLKRGDMRLERLPLDDLAGAKPIGTRALDLLSDFTRFDPPQFGSAEPDHGVAACDEARREDARLHVLIARFEPIAHLVMAAH